jgi:hypothetical protein
MQKRRDMPDALYLREQARRCYRLAREIMDADMRAKLDELGHEFDDRAKELEREGVQNSNGR